MRVLLVQPPSAQHIGFQHMALSEPLGLEAVGGSIRDCHTVLLDMRLESDLEGYLERVKPDAVGIAVPFTTAVYKARQVAERVKKWSPATKVFIGGHHVALSPDDFFIPEVDAVVIGECEETMPELMEAFASGRDLSDVPGLAFLRGEEGVFSPRRPMIKDLSATPIPDREFAERYRERYFYKNHRPVTMVETTRGCPYRCSFCSVWKFYEGRYRSRDAERVVAELETVRSKSVFFSDDNFLHNVRRAERIRDLVVARGIDKRFGFQARTDTIAENPEIIAKWKEVGLDWVLIGFESFREEELAALNKRNSVKANEQAVKTLREHEIQIQAAFIVNPDYDRREFRQLGEYIRRLKLFSPQITILTPLPGTDFFKEKWNDLTSRNYELFDFFHALLPTKLPLEDFYKEFCKLYRRVGLPQTVRNVLTQPFAFKLRDAKTAYEVYNNMLRAKAYMRGHQESSLQPDH